MLNYGIKILLFLTIPITVGVFLLSDSAILLLYGKGFSQTGLVLRIFSSLIIIKGLGDLLCYQTVISIGKEKYLVPAAFLAMIINVILNLLLIPYWHEIGATIASVISEFTVNYVMVMIVRKKVDFSISFSDLIKTIISTVVMGLFVFIIMKLNLSYILTCTLSAMIGFIVFILTNALLKNSFLIEIYNAISLKIEQRRKK